MARGLLGLRFVAEPGERETFRFVPLLDDESVFALETSYGRFVTAESDGDGSPLTSNREEIGEWQRFMFLEVPAELLPQPEARPNIADQVASSVDEALGRGATAGAVETRQSAADRPSAVSAALRKSSLRDKIFRKK